MKIVKIFIATFMLLFVTLQPLLAQTPLLEWARKMGGANTDEGLAITVDTLGNVYTCGRFKGTADFDPGSDTYNLTSEGTWDAFIQKLDYNGNFVWAKQVGAEFYDYGQSIAVDGFGNVYVAGTFQSTVDFDPGPETFNLTSLNLHTGDLDGFILKLDPDGNFLWANHIAGHSGFYRLSLILNRFSDVYLFGSFSGTADFDPGNETSNLTATGYFDVFLQKLDTDGNFQWVKSMEGDGYGVGNSIDIDDAGNIYSTGYFLGTTDFDPGEEEFNLTSAYTNDVFVQKLNPDGSFIWAKQIAGNYADISDAIAVDGLGNAYITGYFEGTTDFDPGPDTLDFIVVGERNIFILKLDTDGNYVWAKQMKGVLQSLGYSIAVDVLGSVYITGYMNGTVDFDPGVDTFYVTSAGNTDAYILKLDTDGNFAWAEKMGSNSLDVGYAIYVDAQMNIYTTGYFIGTVDFAPGPQSYNLISTSAMWDAFVQKLSQSSIVGLSKPPQNAKLVVYPNPTSGIFNIQFEKTIDNAEFIVTDLRGKIIAAIQIQNSDRANISLKESPGVYLITIKSKEHHQTIRVIKE